MDYYPMDVLGEINKLMGDEAMILELRDFWDQMGVDKSIMIRRYGEILGNEELHIRDAHSALDILNPILVDVQNKIKNYIQSRNTKEVLLELYQIFDKCFYIYMKEKQERITLANYNIADDDINDSYLHNRNIEICIINSCNIWIENSVLFQNHLDKEFNRNIQDIDPTLAVDLYIFGSVSMAISLVSLSNRIKDYSLYDGLDIYPKSSDPIVIYRDHPVVYHSLLISGNQDVFHTPKEEELSVDSSQFGIGFCDEYGVPFSGYLRLLISIQKNELRNGCFGCVATTKEKFLNIIGKYKNEVYIEPEKIWTSFVLNKEKLLTSKRESDEIIWKIGVNKERHELRPFIYLDDDTVFIAYQALEQARNIWNSYYLAGGIAYSNVKDKFTTAEENRNVELSKRMVDLIIGKLKEKYTASFCESNVNYKRIFGDKEKEYGDFDIVFYSREVNELFLIESKFYSDSFTYSGLINDFEKTFKKTGYFFHCKERYDLVLNEPEKIKAFIGIEGQVTVHMLFISSKPLEINLRDKDNMITYIPISVFDGYLDGEFTSEDGSSVIRPVITI